MVELDGNKNSIAMVQKLPTIKLEKYGKFKLKDSKRWEDIVNQNLLIQQLIISMEINGFLMLRKVTILMVKLIIR